MIAAQSEVSVEIAPGCTEQSNGSVPVSSSGLS
jgi:hypothetical protein